MRNLLPQKQKYLVNFANSVYDEYRKQKFGIAACRNTGDLWLNEVRRDIVEYQSNNDSTCLLDVSNEQMCWLPIYYSTNDKSCEYISPCCNDGKYEICKCNKGSNDMGY